MPERKRFAGPGNESERLRPRPPPEPETVRTNELPDRLGGNRRPDRRENSRWKLKLVTMVSLTIICLLMSKIHDI